MNTIDYPVISVVTVFLTWHGRVMLLKRSARVGTYQGAWAAVSGYIERLPLRQAYVEVEEEAGLPQSSLALRGIGTPVPVEDHTLNRIWMVHPFLFEIPDDAEVRTDWETDEVRWIEPQELGELITVPGLDQALAAVWPGFGDDRFWNGLAQVATDTTHGATYLARLGLDTVDVYLHRNHLASDQRAVSALGACRPSMGVFPHLAARLLSGKISPSQLSSEFTQATTKSAENASTIILPYHRILTISYSSAVRDAIVLRAQSGERLDVVIAESRPEMEGVTLAQDLSAKGIRVSVITDAQSGIFAQQVDTVLVGCDAITTDDLLWNKAGTSLMMQAAKASGIPCFAVTQTHKIVPPGFPHSSEEQEPDRVGQSQGIKFRNIIFDSTPLSSFNAVCTEYGLLTQEQLTDIRTQISGL